MRDYPALEPGDAEIIRYPAATPAKSTVRLARGTDIEMRPIRWLWPGWLAEGKLHVLGGQPGTGKTTLAMRMAAIVTQAARWPDDSTARLGNIIIWSGEDDPADTLLPRLIASGADRSRVYFVDHVVDGHEHRPFDPSKDMAALRLAIAAAGGARLIIVDPIVSAVSGDSHKNSETRRALQPLVDLAADVGAALIGITHFSKGTAGREPIERITGSIAFGALARVVMVAAREQDGEDGATGRRILARAKSNIGPDEGGFAYALEQVVMPGNDDITASTAAFGERIEGTARDMLATAEGDEDDRDAGTARRQAEDFLLDILVDGPVPTKEVKAAAAGADVAWITVRRAKDKIGVIVRKSGMDGGWMWSLPEGAHSKSKMPTSENVSTLSTVDENEHLRSDSTAISDSAEGAQKQPKVLKVLGAQSLENREHLREDRHNGSLGSLPSSEGDDLDDNEVEL